jgi:hypothetical protein
LRRLAAPSALIAATRLGGAIFIADQNVSLSKLLNQIKIKDTIVFRKSLINHRFLVILVFFPISETIEE